MGMWGYIRKTLFTLQTKDVKQLKELWVRGSKPPNNISRQTSSNPVNREVQVRAQNFNKVTPTGLILLIVPITTFGLGTWQVKRRKWKTELITDLEKRSSNPPSMLPLDLSELEHMEYYPVKLTGEFDHSQELYLGPRSLLVGGDASGQGGIMSQNMMGQSGYLVITPFHLADRDLTILVNRGWVPSKKKNPETRQEGQVQGVVDLEGVVRLNEARAPFIPQNRGNSWFYRDLAKMAEETGAAPVYVEAKFSSTVPGGPIGGQTRITLRNEHMSYILTWYGLSACTAFMWYRKFIHGIPVM